MNTKRDRAWRRLQRRHSNRRVEQKKEHISSNMWYKEEEHRQLEVRRKKIEKIEIQEFFVL